jgi:hypothetical protein
MLSRGVKVCRDAHELAAAVQDLRPGEAMIEEYVGGEMIHVDGLMRDGEVLTCSVSVYLNGCLAFHDGAPLGSAQLDPGDALWRRAAAFTADVVKAMPPVGLSPYHLEVFVTPDEDLVFCEVACRVGGAHVIDVVTRSTGVNPVEVAVRAQAGLPYTLPDGLTPAGQRYGWLLVPPRKGVLVDIARPELAEWIDVFSIRTPVPRAFDGAAGSTDAVCSFVCHGDDHLTLRSRLADCIDLADRLTRWECEETSKGGRRA